MLEHAIKLDTHLWRFDKRYSVTNIYGEYFLSKTKLNQRTLQHIWYVDIQNEYIGYTYNFWKFGQYMYYQIQITFIFVFELKINSNLEIWLIIGLLTVHVFRNIQTDLRLLNVKPQIMLFEFHLTDKIV